LVVNVLEQGPRTGVMWTDALRAQSAPVVW